ncbi:MAG TPA: hypothetical protein VMG61_11810 [Usitatibacter sp.]|nr:hypothetical protein [Usitatibacter sp.]
MKKSLTLSLVAALLAIGSASAQTTGSEVQRNVDQQQRIENGLQSGQLSTKETSQLEKGEQKVDRMEANANKNGGPTAQQAAAIQKAQNRESNAIYRDKHNAVAGNPGSASSKRMQADVQRNVNQQTRIENGVKSGQLTNQETGKLERGQAHVNGAEARAGANGHVGAGEQKSIQARENRQSRHVHNKKHNGNGSATGQNG